MEVGSGEERDSPGDMWDKKKKPDVPSDEMLFDF